MTPKAPTASTDDQADPLPPETIEVAFDRDAASYRVRIQMGGARAGVRQLADANGHCSSLAEATAFTIALILDPDAALPPPASPATVAEPAPAEPAEPRWSIASEAGVGVVLGILRPVAPMAYVQTQVSPHPRFAFGVSGLLLPEQSLPLERGFVDVGLLAAQGRACAYPFAPSLHVGGCAGILAGALRATGRGYPTDGDAERLLLGATFELVASGSVVGAFGWSARLGGFAPFRRQTFGIEGAGVAYEASPVGGLFSVGATFTFR